jgi:putative endonuclease
VYYVYLLTNKSNSLFYTGVTNNLNRRLEEHKSKEFSSFTSKYNLVKLVYYEEFQSIEEAIQREKNLKKWKRSWKKQLIEKVNPDYTDLYYKDLLA